MKDIKLAFGQAIRELREAKHWSQEELGFKSNLDRTYISGVERGVRNVSLVNIEKLSVSLEIAVHEIFQKADR